jgi:hypothetical protein
MVMVVGGVLRMWSCVDVDVETITRKADLGSKVKKLKPKVRRSCEKKKNEEISFTRQEAEDVS